MAGHLADGAARAFGNGANFAFAGREKRQDTISFPKIGTLEDNRFGGIAVRRAHEEHLAYTKKDAPGIPRRIGGDERIRTAGAAFAEPCLTTWRRRPIGNKKWSGRRGSNPRLSPWQGDALPL